MAGMTMVVPVFMSHHVFVMPLAGSVQDYKSRFNIQTLRNTLITDPITTVRL